MGRRRLIVQADLTSEEDVEFLTWVKEQRKRRKLGEQIRQGLRIQYERLHGRGPGTVEPALPAPELRVAPAGEGRHADRPNVASKLQKLVGSL